MKEIAAKKVKHNEILCSTYKKDGSLVNNTMGRNQKDPIDPLVVSTCFNAITIMQDSHSYF